MRQDYELLLQACPRWVNPRMKLMAVASAGGGKGPREVSGGGRRLQWREGSGKRHWAHCVHSDGDQGRWVSQSLSLSLLWKFELYLTFVSFIIYFNITSISVPHDRSCCGTIQDFLITSLLSWWPLNHPVFLRSSLIIVFRFHCVHAFLSYGDVSLLFPLPPIPRSLQWILLMQAKDYEDSASP